MTTTTYTLTSRNDGAQFTVVTKRTGTVGIIFTVAYNHGETRRYGLVALHMNAAKSQIKNQETALIGMDGKPVGTMTYELVAL